MTQRKRLIVNADDFGRSPGINRGVIKAHEHGIVTSASVMVCWPAARAAIDYGRAHPALSLGLHLDIGEWIYSDGAWIPRYLRVAGDDEHAIAAEFARQIAHFQDLMRSAPTHLDSHQHVHMRSPARDAALAAATRLGVPLRQCNDGIRYCGEFYAQSAEGAPLPELIGVPALLDILHRLAPGITEMVCHPGFADDCDTTYRYERIDEVRALCSPLVRQAIVAEAIELCSFSTLDLGRWKAIADDREGPT